MFIPSLATSMNHYNPALQSLFEIDYLMNAPPIDGNYTTMMKESITPKKTYNVIENKNPSQSLICISLYKKRGQQYIS